MITNQELKKMEETNEALNKLYDNVINTKVEIEKFINDVLINLQKKLEK